MASAKDHEYGVTTDASHPGDLRAVANRSVMAQFAYWSDGQTNRHLDRSSQGATRHPHPAGQGHDAVIESTRDSTALLILGPGEAKGELRARLLHARQEKRISAVETEGPMSEGQLVARVKAHFAAA
jgi:hypothetical protein